MSPAFDIRNSRGVTIKNSTLSGFNVGIKSVNSDITTRNVTFEDVAQPFSVERSKADVANTRIRESRQFKASNGRTGWVPDGPALPARCDRCGTIFPSKHYCFRTSLFYGRNNTDICPVCDNENAKVDDGLFDLTTEAIGLVETIAKDRHDFQIFKGISQDILSGAVPVLDGLDLMKQNSLPIKALAERAERHGFNAGGHGFNRAWYVGIFISFLFFAAGIYLASAGETPDVVPTLVSLHERCIELTNELLLENVRENNIAKEVNEYPGVEADNEPELEPPAEGLAPEGVGKSPRVGP